MKPFNLEAALKGDPVVTVGGEKVLRIAYLPEADENYRLVAVIEGNSGVWLYSEANLRMAERTFMLGGIEVPLPETEAPEVGTRYYLPNLRVCRGYDTSTWGNLPEEHWRLKESMVHLTPEAASTHAKALISVTKAALNGN